MIRTKDDAVSLIATLCAFAGPPDFIGEIRDNAQESGLAAAIDRHDTGFLFGLLMRALSYQGISDRISDGYIEAHGNASLDQVTSLLAEGSSACPLLKSFETYRGCGYRKGAKSCSNPAALANCPVPKLPLRKGGLNQLAFSLGLFIRDRCDGDLVGHINRVISEVASAEDAIEAARAILVDDLSTVHAVSAKLANMVLAEILVAGGVTKPGWEEVGCRMIAVDTLVHNFLHRTGVLAALGFSHTYGSACYGAKGCEAAIKVLSAAFDARSINPDYPTDFPRFVQFAIWRFCSEGGLGICNGRQIDDRRSCGKTDCVLGDRCSRIALHPEDVILVEMAS